MIDGNVEALVFAGVGQWFIKAVVRGNWSGRQASSDVVPPSGSVAVVDMCAVAKYPVREGYARYGAAAFFGQDCGLLGIWLPDEKRMTTPESDRTDWLWAQWVFKCTMVYVSFVPKHLVDIHWITVNTMNIALRETLEHTHPVRRLLQPFTHRSITINREATQLVVAER